MFEIGRENVQLKIKTVKSIRNRYLAYSLSQQFFSTTEVNSQTKSKASYNRASLQKQPTVHGASTEWRCETSWC